MQFTNFAGPRIGGGVRADWGRLIERAIMEQRPRPRPGQTMSRNAYGVMMGPEPEGSKAMDFVGNYPFKVRWQITNQEGTSGEWQIYLPVGCATLTQGLEINAYVPVNDQGKEADGEDAFRWYKIPDPPSGEASVGRMGKYVAKTWGVYLHMKPWPRMKAVASQEDDEFGKSKWIRQVATIGIVEIGSGQDKVTHHFVERLIQDTAIANTWDSGGAFALRFRMEDDDSDEPVLEIVNVDKMVGRLNKAETTPHDVTGATTVWVRIAHEETEYELTIETDLEADEAQSDDDQTVVKIWDLDENVPTHDGRSNITGLNLDFYTNPPEVPEG